VIKENGNKSGS